MRRRRFLALAGAGGGVLAGGVAVDNLLLGYGTVTGTNLLEQDVESLVNERLGPIEGRPLDVAGTALELSDGVVVGDETLSWSTPRREIRRVERERAVPEGALVELLADVPALRSRAYSVEAVSVEAFFERAAGAELRPYTVAALRGPRVRDVRPAVVEAFAGVDPVDPREVTVGLVDGFREHTFYDAPRYVAGAVEDNVLRGWGPGDLRDPFDSPAGFRALLNGENDGMFCYDFSYRAMEALHAVPAPDQAVPVVTAYVRDQRHKHAYAAVATVLRGEDGLTLLVTFVDYTPTTAAHTFGVTRLVDDDPNAYDTRHRATGIYWNRRTYA